MSMERLRHMFDKWDRVKDEFLEARSRERMILDVLRREEYPRWPHVADESRPE